MPELPEVETVKRGLAPSMEGSVIKQVELRRADLRFPFPDHFAKDLTGSKIHALGRRAKYLLVELDIGKTLIMHLGMSGSFRIETTGNNSEPGQFHHDKSKNPKHDHVVFQLSNGSTQTAVIYNDPRRFGYMDLIKSSELQDHRYFAKLGIEPTGNSLSGTVIAELFAGKAAPLKSALLDQSLIAGLGNIYVCEILWRSRLSPERKAATLVAKNGRATGRAEDLAIHTRDVIREAIEAGGSSLRDHRQADGSLGYFQHSFDVYDQEGEKCHRVGCKGTIERIVQSGRSTFLCPNCQI